MVKIGTTPIHRRVAQRAIEWETSLLMIRIGRAVVLRQMARVAVLGRTGEVSACVALGALQAAMRTCKRELRLRVIEHSACPRRRRMAL